MEHLTTQENQSHFATAIGMTPNQTPTELGISPPAPQEHLGESLVTGQIQAIAVHQIRPNPAQPRAEFTEEALVTLADSIKQYGILQPLTVRPIPNPDTEGAIYELVAGERRLRASKLLGLPTVPCIILQIDGKKSAELAIIENIQRQDLNIFEEASAIAALIDLYALTQDEIAKRLSTSQSYVANKLRILRLSAFEREKILRHNLTERHARALLRIDSPEGRAAVLREIISRGLNVAATEEYIERFLQAKEPKKKRQTKIILKDIRIFYNTIDKAISTVRSAGVNIISSKAETPDAIELTIRIPKKPGMPAGQGKAPQKAPSSANASVANAGAANAPQGFDASVASTSGVTPADVPISPSQAAPGTPPPAEISGQIPSLPVMRAPQGDATLEEILAEFSPAKPY